MKKLSLSLAVASIAFALTACGGHEEHPHAVDKVAEAEAAATAQAPQAEEVKFADHGAETIGGVGGTNPKPAATSDAKANDQAKSEEKTDNAADAKADEKAQTDDKKSEEKTENTAEAKADDKKTEEAAAKAKETKTDDKKTEGKKAEDTKKAE